MPQTLVTVDLPQTTLATTVADTPSPGSTYSATTATEFQSLLNAALPGDIITLVPGTIYSGNFTIPAKTGATSDLWITVKTAGNLPAEGTRFNGATDATTYNPPVIRSPNSLPPLATSGAASYWRFIGIEITVATDQTISNGLVDLGAGSETQLADLPTDIVIDRCYVHGHSTLNTHRGVTINAKRLAVIDSTVSEIHHEIDCQAVWGWNGPGPYKIQNNYLEASTEVLGFGGADPALVGNVPSDVEIRGNHITRPMAWKGGPWLVKNLIEFKCAKRVLIEHNVMENSWPNGQQGWAFVLWSVNQQGGATSSETSHITVRKNLIRNCAAGFQLNEKFGVCVSMHHVAITNNVLIGVDNPLVTGGGYGFLIQGIIDQLSIEHNTFFVPTITSFEWVVASPLTDHIVKNNLCGGGSYPLFASPTNTWTWVVGAGHDASFAGNVVALASQFGAGFPAAGNAYSATLESIGLAGGGGAAYSNDSLASDLALGATSPYLLYGTDGTDPGADITAVLAAVDGVTTGSPTNTTPGDGGSGAPTQTLTTLTLIPSTLSVVAGASSAVIVSALDQLGVAMAVPAFTAASANTSIATVGAFSGTTVPINGIAAGVTTVSVTSGSVTSNATTVTVTAPVDPIVVSPGPIKSHPIHPPKIRDPGPKFRISRA